MGVVGDDELFVDCSGKPHVDVLIRRPVLAAELRPHVHHVAERPQPFVRESAVVRGERRLVNPEPSQLVRRVVRGNRHSVGRHRRPRGPQIRRRAQSTRHPAPASERRGPRRRHRSRAMATMWPSPLWLWRYGSRLDTTMSGLGAVASSSPARARPWRKTIGPTSS